MAHGDGRIAFSRWEPDEGEWLFTMRPDGTGLRLLYGRLGLAIDREEKDGEWGALVFRSLKAATA